MWSNKYSAVLQLILTFTGFGGSQYWIYWYLNTKTPCIISYNFKQAEPFVSAGCIYVSSVKRLHPVAIVWGIVLFNHAQLFVHTTAILTLGKQLPLLECCFKPTAAKPIWHAHETFCFSCLTRNKIQHNTFFIIWTAGSQFLCCPCHISYNWSCHRQDIPHLRSFMQIVIYIQIFGCQDGKLSFVQTWRCKCNKNIHLLENAC